MDTRDIELVFNPARGVRFMALRSDSDWAGDKGTRKSATCGVIRVAECTLAAFARGQAVLSQSSCEAEVYAGVTTVAEGAHIQQILGWAGLPLRLKLGMDSSAARSAMSRRGVGRMRHMEVKVLWIQDMVFKGRLLLEKVAGTATPRGYRH